MSRTVGSRKGLIVGLAGLCAALALAALVTFVLTSTDDGAEQAADDRAASTPAPAVAPATAPATTAPTTTLPTTTASTTTITTLPPTTATTTTTLPVPPAAPETYVVAHNESLQQAKQVGVDVVAAITNYEVGESTAEIAARITDDTSLQAVVAEHAEPLVHADMWSRGTVEYAQLGGHRNSRASIMVVVRQDIGVGSEVERSETRTVDVRVDLVDGTWVFVDLPDVGGERLERPPDLANVAAAVVDDPRIELADSAHWDIYAGRISPTLLRLLTDLADQTSFAAVVLKTGHPHNVFETDRISNHTVGRAIDIYRVGDTRVIDNSGPDSYIHDIVEWIYANPLVTEVGSPWALDGSGGRSFTNDVHLDHIHMGTTG